MATLHVGFKSPPSSTNKYTARITMPRGDSDDHISSYSDHRSDIRANNKPVEMSKLVRGQETNADVETIPHKKIDKTWHSYAYRSNAGILVLLLGGLVFSILAMTQDNLFAHRGKYPTTITVFGIANSSSGNMWMGPWIMANIAISVWSHIATLMFDSKNRGKKNHSKSEFHASPLHQANANWYRWTDFAASFFLYSFLVFQVMGQWDIYYQIGFAGWDIVIFSLLYVSIRLMWTLKKYKPNPESDEMATWNFLDKNYFIWYLVGSALTMVILKIALTVALFATYIDHSSVVKDQYESVFVILIFVAYVLGLIVMTASVYALAYQLKNNSSDKLANMYETAWVWLGFLGKALIIGLYYGHLKYVN